MDVYSVTLGGHLNIEIEKNKSPKNMFIDD
jgi:hypothetical protein